MTRRIKSLYGYGVGLLVLSASRLWISLLHIELILSNILHTRGRSLVFSEANLVEMRDKHDYFNFYMSAGATHPCSPDLYCGYA